MEVVSNVNSASQANIIKEVYQDYKTYGHNKIPPMLHEKVI